MPTSVAVDGFDKELECSVCMDSFRDAVELKPCGHVFCKECAAQLASCAICRKNIIDRPPANLLIRNMALKVPVKCEGCQWIGSREQSLRHRCGDPVPAAAAAQAQSLNVRPNAPAATPAKQPSPQVPPGQQQQQQPVPTGQFPQQGYPQQQQPPQGYYPAYPQQHQAYYPPYPQHQQGQYPGYPQQQQQQPYYPPYPQPQQGQYPAGYPPPQPPGGYPQPYPPQPGYPAYPQPMHGGGAPPVGYGPVPVPITGSAQPMHPQQQQAPQAPPPLIEIPDRDPWLAYGMSMDEYDQMMVIFMTFDTDGSGALDKHEVTVMARFLNYAQTQPEIDRMFAVMDRDRSGTLSLAELLTWMKYNRPDPQALYGLPQSKYHEVLFQFHQFDTNADGSLNEREFAQLCRSLRYTTNDAEAKRIFAAIDIDRSGSVDVHEFLLYRSRAGQKT